MALVLTKISILKQYFIVIFVFKIQKVVDFDNLSQHEEAFKDLDVLFCCLGTKTNEGEVTLLIINKNLVFQQLTYNPISYK